MSRHPAGWATCVFVALTAGAALGCVSSSTVGASAVAPSKAVITSPEQLLVTTGQPPPATPMCMIGEPGCIETGWGPGWDRSRTMEGQMTMHHRAANMMSHSAIERSVHPDHAFSGPCRVYWELDDDLGSAPLGDCD